MGGSQQAEGSAKKEVNEPQSSRLSLSGLAPEFPSVFFVLSSVLRFSSTGEWS